jgi:hypothetical protein
MGAVMSQDFARIHELLEHGDHVSDPELRRWIAQAKIAVNVLDGVPKYSLVVRDLSGHIRNCEGYLRFRKDQDR